MATAFWPAVGRVGRQLIVVSNGRIKEEVEERLLSTVVDPKYGIIRPYLVSGVNTTYKVIVYINKLWY